MADLVLGLVALAGRTGRQLATQVLVGAVAAIQGITLSRLMAALHTGHTWLLRRVSTVCASRASCKEMSTE